MALLYGPNKQVIMDDSGSIVKDYSVLLPVSKKGFREFIMENTNGVGVTNEKMDAVYFGLAIVVTNWLEWDRTKESIPIDIGIRTIDRVIDVISEDINEVCAVDTYKVKNYIFNVFRIQNRCNFKYIREILVPASPLETFDQSFSILNRFFSQSEIERFNTHRSIVLSSVMYFQNTLYYPGSEKITAYVNSEY